MQENGSVEFHGPGTHTDRKIERERVAKCQCARRIMPAKKKDSAKTAKKGGAEKAPTTDPAGAPSAASTVEPATVKAAKGSKKGKGKKK
ncbi:uncharacterized protein LOC117578408 [Drosophila guanche]|uniref:uncharacterized protein LOC117578408 n=1 Tax=Drosophila guanche TaxID=7266 RepID=UPI001470AD63|nr:uncharacterized protein LOC117578408 [Drosophila guanche]